MREGMSKQEIFEIRQARVRWRSRWVVIASIGCLLFVPVWGFLRLYFCWGESQGAFIYWFCELHWVITFLLVIFLAALVMMAYELRRTSIESDKAPPTTIEEPWIPCTKQIAKSADLISKNAHWVSAKASEIPGMHRIAMGTTSIAQGIKAIPGAKIVGSGMKKLKDSVRWFYQAGREFEHGRALCEKEKPGIWTLLFTVLALALALFMIFGPFNY